MASKMILVRNGEAAENQRDLDADEIGGCLDESSFDFGESRIVDPPNREQTSAANAEVTPNKDEGERFEDQ